MFSFFRAPSDIIPHTPAFDPAKHNKRVQALFDAYPCNSKERCRAHADKMLVQLMKKYPARCSDDFYIALHTVIEVTFNFEMLFRYDRPLPERSEPAGFWEYALSPKRLERATDAMLDILSRVINKYIPTTIWSPNPTASTLPLIEVTTNPHGLIHDLFYFFISQRLDEKNELFPTLQSQLTDNQYLASDIPQGAKNATHKFVDPLHSELSPSELAAKYFNNTAFVVLFELPVPFAIPQEIRFQHQWVIARPGAGKSTLLQGLIKQDLELVAKGEASVVVMDSNRELVKAVEGLKLFAPGQPLHGKLVSIDLEDVEHPLALNLFDLGADNSAARSALDRESLRNAVLALYEYFFSGLLSAELTSKQSTLFNFTIQFMLEIPGATLDTLIELMQPKGAEKYAHHFGKLDDDARSYLDLKFNQTDLLATKSQVVDRLFAVKRIRTLARMFAATKSRLDLFKEMASSKVILINTPLNLLQEEGVEIVSRFFLAMILLAGQKRILQSRDKRLPTFVYLDECQDVIKKDTKITAILDQARKLNIGMILAHQRLAQLKPDVLDALYGATSIKYAAQISDAAAHALARDMRCTPEFILTQPPYHFAAFVRNLTPRALSLKVPYVDLLKEPRMSAAEYEAVRRLTRAAYANLPQPVSPPVDMQKLAAAIQQPAPPPSPAASKPSAVSTTPDVTKRAKWKK